MTVSEGPSRDQSFVVARAKATVLRVPCPVPVQTSFGTMHDRPALFLKLEDDFGTLGLGEVWCNFPVCGAEHRASLLDTTLLPSLIGVQFDSPAQCFEVLQTKFARLAIQTGEPGPIAQCLAGIDVALWDMVARRAEVPLFRLLGGRDATLSAYASGINPTGARQMVDACRSTGHRSFKLKVGFDRAGDLENIAEISAGLGPAEQLMIDANQAWTLDEAIDVLPQLAEYPLAWLEEPIMADRPLVEWQALANAGSIPLAAGENTIGSEGFDRAIEGDWLGILQPDLCKWGGISGVLPVAQKALAAGKRYCPHYLGGGVGLAASAHLLAAVGGDGMLEIDANENPLRDMVFSPTIADGQFTLAEEPGLGVHASFEALLASGLGRQ